jgi:hypothetical protein
MKRKPVKTGVILCPDDPRWAKGEPMYQAMACPWHLVGKVCKLCGKPTAEHSIIIEEGKK